MTSRAHIVTRKEMVEHDKDGSLNNLSVTLYWSKTADTTYFYWEVHIESVRPEVLEKLLS